MIKFHSFKVKNGVTWKELNLNLKDQGLIYISGENGAGKSIIWDLLEYLLFGSTTKKIKSNNFIRKYAKKCSFELIFSKNENLYKISHHKKRSGKRAKSELNIYTKENKNWKDITPHRSPGKNEPQDLVVSLLGLSNIEYKGIINLTQESSHVLVNGLPSERKEYLSNLFDLGIYDFIVDELKKEFKKIKDKKAEIKEKENIKIELENQLTDIPEDIENKTQKIQKVIEEYKNKEEILNTKLNSSVQYYNKLNNLKTEFSKYNIKYTKIDKKYSKSLSTKIIKLDQKKSKILKDKEKNAIYLSKKNNLLDNIEKLKILEKKEKNKYSGNIKKYIDQLNINLKNIKIEKNKYELLVKLSNLEEKYTSALEVLNTFKKENKKIINKYADKKVSEFDDKIIDFKTAINEVTGRIKALSSLDGGKCHVCGHEYNPEANEDEIEKLKTRKEENIKNLELYNKVKQKIKDYNKYIEDKDNCNHVKNSFLESNPSLEKMFKKINNKSIKKEMDAIKNKINTYGSSEDIEYELSDCDDFKFKLTKIKENIKENKSVVDIDTDYKKLYDRQAEQITKISAKIEKLKIISKEVDAYLELITNNKNIIPEKDIDKYEKKSVQYKTEIEEMITEKGKLNNQLYTYNKIRKRIKSILSSIKNKDKVYKKYEYIKILREIIPEVKENVLHSILLDLQSILPMYINYMFGDTGNIEFIVSENNSGIDLYKRSYLKNGDYIDVSARSLSSGEKQALSIALIWTLHKMVLSRKNVDILILDEVERGLSDSKLDSFISLINDKKKEIGTIILMSHIKDLKNAKIDQYWRVEKQEEISSLVRT